MEPVAQWIEHAQQRGAKASEVLLEEYTGSRIVVERGRVAREEPLSGSELTVRVWVEGGGNGVARGGPAELDALLDKATALADLAPADPFAGPVGRFQESMGGLGILDRRYAALQRSDRMDVILSAERTARTSDRRVTTGTFCYEDRHVVRRFANSKGAVLRGEETRYDAHGAIHFEGIELKNGVSSRTFASIASIPFGTQLAQRADVLLAPGAARLTGPIPVVLPPLAVARLVAWMGEELHPQRIEQRTTFLVPQEGGGPLFSGELHIVDDGTLPGGLRTRAFDDRGVPPVPITLIREGHVSGWPLDPEAARRLNVRPTGHCVGDDVRCSNLRVKGGTRTIRAHLSERDLRAFQLDDLADLSGLDPLTGQLTTVVHGQLVHGTRDEGPVRSVRLTGDLREVLQRIVAVASDTDRHGHVDAPAMLVEGFVTG